MKRVTFSGRLPRAFDLANINGLLDEIKLRNCESGLTGFLLILNGMAFQMVEGDEQSVDNVLAKVVNEGVQKDVKLLQVEKQITERQCKDWTSQYLESDGEHALSLPVAHLFQLMGTFREVLEKYTQPTILKYLEEGLNPLDVPSVCRRRIIMFCDIMSFSLLCRKLPIEDLLKLVDIYYNCCTKMISDHGGEVNKFIGDCVMAYFPEDKADGALQAGLDILYELEGLRAIAPSDSPLQVLQCGIGFASGEVIEGNLGLYKKMEYTVQGDAVNRAAYIETLTRRACRGILLSEDVQKLTYQDWAFIHAGDFIVKPEVDAIPLFSIDVPITQVPCSQSRLIDRINALSESS